MSAPQPIQPGSYKAAANGLVIGVVGWPSSAAPGCVGYAIGQTAGMTIYATGGNLGAFGPGWSDYQASNGNSFTMPVAAGDEFALQAAQVDGGLQQAEAPIWFYWVSLDPGAAEGEGFSRTGEAPAELAAPREPAEGGSEK